MNVTGGREQIRASCEITGLFLDDAEQSRRQDLDNDCTRALSASRIADSNNTKCANWSFES